MAAVKRKREVFSDSVPAEPNDGFVQSNKKKKSRTKSSDSMNKQNRTDSKFEVPESKSNPTLSQLSQPLTLAQRKAILKEFQSNPSTLSSLRRPEMLMDFFTDCLNTKDLGLAVPALTGLFHLITTRNLDYPLFFTRLYGLLDENILHSKHRSRFLRHLETFLNPTNHLPATMIASFIKRLSRLSLFAPPAAIVAIVPFIYNLLKQHPTTTFMIHRHPFPPYYTQSTDKLGVDPFDPLERTPQLTRAIDSSLWELDTLRSHYHPTVAGVARVIAEQFTKQAYSVEDFLDHGYGSLMEAELGKDLLPNHQRKPQGEEEAAAAEEDDANLGSKEKARGLTSRREERRRRRKGETVVEYKIPKTIFATPQISTNGVGVDTDGAHHEPGDNDDAVSEQNLMFRILRPS